MWPALIDLKFARPFPPCLVHTIFYRLWLLCVQADLARAIKEECEGELAVAMPILEDALAALDTIKEADITYIRKLGNPPGAIKLVMEVGHLLKLAYSSADRGPQRPSEDLSMNVLQSIIESTPPCALHQTVAIEYHKLIEGVSLWAFASFSVRWFALHMDGMIRVFY